LDLNQSKQKKVPKSYDFRYLDANGIGQVETPTQEPKTLPINIPSEGQAPPRDLSRLRRARQQQDKTIHPLFDDTLDFSKIGENHPKPSGMSSMPRSFDAGRLIIHNIDGDVLKDLRESPCYGDIGFNPDLTDDQVLREYEACESEKRAKKIWTGIAVLFVGGFLWLLIRSSLRKGTKTN